MHDLKNFPRLIFGFLMIATSFLQACGGSVLPKPGAPKVNQPLPQPAPEPRPEQSRTPPMTFEASKTEQVAVLGGVAKILFAQSTDVSAFDVNNAQNLWVLELKVRSESIDEATFENFVKAKMRVNLVIQNRIVAQNEFESVGTLALKNIGEEDQMTGELIDMATGKVTLKISATRVASDTEEKALQNPWSRQLELVQSPTESVVLGSPKGHFSGLLEEP